VPRRRRAPRTPQGGLRSPGCVARHRRAVIKRDRFALAVASNPARRLAASGQQVERLADERTPDDVAGDDDRVDRIPIQVGQHSPQRRQVPVDIGEHGDPHAPTLSREAIS
jgi:hypothetical protein